MSEVLRTDDMIYPNYITEGSYYTYLNNKMYNERRLATMMNSSGIITEAGLSKIYAVHEAKLGDKVKSTWKKFVEFIKGLVSKFMESMTNLLLDEKDYLEKYKDIILKRKPREDFEYSYTGNYETGINRMMNTELPVFNYDAHAKYLKEEGDAAILQELSKNTIKGFTYDENETLADQFKSYYLALEEGEKQGKFTDLNWTNMYNFCIGFKKINDVVDKDVKHLESSTNTIQQALQKELNAQKQQQGTNTVTNQQGDNSGENTAVPAAANGNGQGEHSDSDAEDEQIKKATAAFGNSALVFQGHYFIEADDDNKSVVSKGTNLNITNSNATKQMGSYTGDAAKNVQSDDDTTKGNVTAMKKNQAEDPEAVSAQIIDQICNKWIRICNPIITAKMYACQKIAKDYMEIIRTHVRSYGGKDLKNDKESIKSAQHGDNYQKNSAQTADNNKKQGEEAKQQDNGQ